MGANQVDRFGNQNLSAFGPLQHPTRQMFARGAPGNTINHPTSYWVPSGIPTGSSSRRSTSSAASATTRSTRPIRPSTTCTSTAWSPTSESSISAVPTTRCAHCRCTRGHRRRRRRELLLRDRRARRGAGDRRSHRGSNWDHPRGPRPQGRARARGQGVSAPSLDDAVHRPGRDQVPDRADRHGLRRGRR